MNRLKTAAKVELALIGAAALACYGVGKQLPAAMTLGSLLLELSALLLAQSLLRDLWILYSRRQTSPNMAPIKARCMCAESTIGMSGIIIGLLLISFGIERPLSMSATSWTLAVSLVLLAGFLLRDYIIE